MLKQAAGQHNQCFRHELTQNLGNRAISYFRGCVCVGPK